ncbi:MAG: helix-turn-helix domain-containing protein [Alphaproteobacteria bacterium]|nr:helix-turn-helix domain-containing protein [Alphaproteobacteria bacterium]
MKSSRSQPALPMGVRRALKKLGQDISAARRRRRLSMALMAERAFISRNTLARVEKGDAGVSMGIYASVLFVLGMSDRLGDLADAASDQIGLSLEEERLPRRIRTAQLKSSGTDHGT